MSQSQPPPAMSRQHQHQHQHQHYEAQDELHMSGMSPLSSQQQHPQMSPRDFAPHLAADLDQPSSSSASASASAAAQPQRPSFQPTGNSSVPNVLQPGGLSARPPVMSANTAPNLPTIQGPSMPQAPGSHHQLQQHHHHHNQPSSQHQQTLLPQHPQSPPSLQPQSPQQQHQQQHQLSAQGYQTPSRPSLAMSHSYSRSSPAAGYDAPSSSYHAYTPTTPGGSSSQYMSPSDPPKYNAPGSQRNISSTPLGLADIRPRADSSMSDAGYDPNNTQPGTSNYMAPWALYAFDWCKWQPQGNSAGKLAVGSYLEDGHNFIQILESQVVSTPPEVYTPGTSKYSLEFTKVAEATHSYPVTRLLWEPPSSQKQSTDLLATSGDHLRLWSLPSETPANPGNTITRSTRDSSVTKLTPLALLSNSKTPDHTAPLTSLDWNTVSPSLIITSSIDTTCTIWDIPSLTAKTQLIAHDKEVYDVRFCAKSVDVFVSCGQDGSVRMFDLRSLEHSTIIYEPTGKEERDASGERTSPTLAQQTMSNPPPLLRLATSPHDTHLLATFAQDSNTIRILDVRQPGQALLELRGHTGPVNCLEWSPHRRGMLASGADDCQVLLWDLLSSNSTAATPSINGAPQTDNQRSPVASWECDYEVGNLGWVPHLQSSDYGEWLGVSAGRGVWGTRVG